MTTMVFAYLKDRIIRIVTPSGVERTAYTHEDKILQEVARLIEEEGYSLVSTSPELIVLEQVRYMMPVSGVFITK